MLFQRILAAALAVTPLWVAAQQLTVSAAASLTSVFTELAPKFEATKPGVTLRLNFAASGVLMQQLIQGAPVDVFASADQVTLKRGLQKGLLDADTLRDFAGNSVVLVVPAQGGPEIGSLADLARPGIKRIAIGKPATVPVGSYTREALESANLWTALAAKFVTADSARQVLDYVARGEVDAGFVYGSDVARATDKTKVILTLTGHTPVRYPIAVVSSSTNKQLARDFIEFLGTPLGLDVLRKHGFGRP
jgi:molybdate transport system substrate-binding protein